MSESCQDFDFVTDTVLAGRKDIAPPDMIRVVRLTMHARDKVEAFLDGRHASDLTLSKLLKHFPLDWRDQRP